MAMDLSTHNITSTSTSSPTAITRIYPPSNHHDSTATAPPSTAKPMGFLAYANGGPFKRPNKNNHHPSPNPHEPPPGITPTAAVSYKECMRNHAATIGGHALDGCCEFMPSPSSNYPPDPTSLRCAACGCHRNFHRRDPDDPAPLHRFPTPTTTTAAAHHPPPPLPRSSPPQPSPPTTTTTTFLAAPHLLTSMKKSGGGDHSTSILTPTTIPKPATNGTNFPPSPLTPATVPKPVITTTTTTTPLTPTNTSVLSTSPLTPTPTIPTTTTTTNGGSEKNLNPSSGNRSADPATVALTIFGNSNTNNGRKRFRTKFSQDQKMKMYEFSAKLGWKMQKVEKKVVDDFCNEIGVGKEVLKVWMHNNKNTYGRIKDFNNIGCDGSGGGNSNINGSERSMSPVVLKEGGRITTSTSNINVINNNDNRVPSDMGLFYCSGNNGNDNQQSGKLQQNHMDDVHTSTDSSTGDEFQVVSANGSSSSSG